MVTAVAALSIAIVLVPRCANAAEPAAPRDHHRLKWRWHRFTAAEYVLTGVLAATYLTIEFGVKPPSEANWRGGILFDDDVRDAMVANSRAGRDRAAIASDIFTVAPQLIAAFDTVVVPLAFDDWNFDVAAQMGIIDIQTVAIIGLFSRIGHRFIARERPDVEPCRSDREYNGLCLRGALASFPSGHTASAFGGAGLVCAHHAHLPLYGGGIQDVLVCVAASAMATTAGVLRLTSDRHYASDVLVGAAFGVGAGFALPYFVHYRKPEGQPEQRPQSGWGLEPIVTQDSVMLGVSGFF